MQSYKIRISAVDHGFYAGAYSLVDIAEDLLMSRIPVGWVDLMLEYHVQMVLDDVQLLRRNLSSL